MINQKKLKCRRCYHTWITRKRTAAQNCPNCRIRGWWFTVPNICDVCKRNFMHLAEHHIDGDSTNSKMINRIKLCVSCHGHIHRYGIRASGDRWDAVNRHHSRRERDYVNSSKVIQIIKRHRQLLH